MKKPELYCVLRTLSVVAVAVLPLPAGAVTASMVRDINVSSDGPTSDSPSHLVPFQGKILFDLWEPSTGSELWMNDGTATGTVLLADTCPGPCNGEPRPLGTLGSSSLWAAKTELGEVRIWRTDGTRAGTWPLTLAILGGRYDSSDQLILTTTLASGRLYFPACTDEAGCELWSSDGTREGTRMVKDLVPGRQGSRIAGLTTAGARAVFLHSNANVEAWEVWVSDGTDGGTHSVAPVPGRLSKLAAAGGRLFFVARSTQDGEELWVSDGTGPGTRPVTQFAAPNPFTGSFLEDSPLFAAGNLVYFLADDVLHGLELWRTDGTQAGTRRITDFGEAEPFDSRSDGWSKIVPLGERVVFMADDGLTGNQLWVTAGTPESTAPLRVPCGFGCTIWPPLVRAGTRVVFEADDSIWSTDGTPGGTVPILESCQGSCLSSFEQIVEVSGAVYFASGSGAPELWRTDGTAGGTRRVATLQDGGRVVNRLEVAVAGSRTFFAAVDALGGGLWAADPEEVHRLTDAVPGGRGSRPQGLTAYRDRLFFSAFNDNTWALWASGGTPETTAPVAGTESEYFVSLATHPTVAGPWLFFTREMYNWSLWRTDGTAAGTTEVTPGLTVSGSPAAYGGAVFFLARPNSGGGQSHLWKSDGTPGGTAEVFHLPPILDEPPSSPRFLTSVGSEMYFRYGYWGQQLWRSDGTAQGTSRVIDFDYSGYYEDPQLTRAGPYTYFINAAPDGHGVEVWRTDGTEQGTALVIDANGTQEDSHPLDLTEFQGRLYFFAQTPSGKRGLWRTEGTSASSTVLAEFVVADPRRPPVTYLTVAAGRLFFVADDGTHGAELWQSDGTAAGTRLVRDIRPGPFSSRISGLTAAGGRLWLTADDGLHGAELWQSDGTEAGARMVQDIAPMALSSTPEQLTAVGDRLYFTADDGATGREVWSLPLPGPAGCQPSSTRLCLSGGRFQVEAAWRDFQGNTGVGRATSLTGDTGYFWFFDPANVEAVIKVLDGRGLNNHFWVFYGALSSVEYTLTVTDTETGLTRRYFNPAGRLASVGDTRGFGPLGAFSRVGPASAVSLQATERTDPAAATGSCQASATRLCLNGRRFAVEASWQDFQGNTGSGKAVSLTGDTGYFWFFDSANVEVVLKVLDGTPVNGRHWVFYGALSSVEYTLTVTDTQTGKVKTYKNPSGRFASVADTKAF